MKTPRELGGAFASEQGKADGRLMNSLQAILKTYTVDQQAEIAEVIAGYDEQAKATFAKTTQATRRTEFKTILNMSTDAEKRQTLFNILPDYKSVQTLYRDLKALENGKAVVNDEGKVEKVKAEKTETNEDNSADESLTLDEKTNPGDVLDILEGIMQWAHGKGYAKASDLLLQAMSAIGTKE